MSGHCRMRAGSSTRPSAARPPPWTGTRSTATESGNSASPPRARTDGIVELLDSCLLMDEELAAGQDRWKQLPDALDDMLDPVA